VATHLAGQSLASILLSLSLCCESIRLSLNCTKAVWINEVRYGNILQCVSTVTPVPHCILRKLWYCVVAHQPKTTLCLLWIIICSTSIQTNIKQWNWQQMWRSQRLFCLMLPHIVLLTLFVYSINWQNITYYVDILASPMLNHASSWW